MLIKCVYCSRGIRNPILAMDQWWHQRCWDKENRREERQARREAADPMYAAEISEDAALA